MFCPNCGGSLNGTEEFCSNCGKRLIEESTTKESENLNYAEIPKKEKNSSKLLILVTLVILAVIGGIVAINIFRGNEKEKFDSNNDTNNNQSVENDNLSSNDNLNNNDNGNISINPDEIYTGDKININIATIGHVNHGKSTLTSAITKLYGEYVDYETISQGQEMSENGIKYHVSHVNYETANRHYSHYDFLGHVDYIKSVVSGAVDLDGAILVVAATDGIMAQTREHIKLAQQAGLSKIVVYISKCDLVDNQDLISLVEMEVRALLSEYGFDGDNTPIIKGSAKNALDGNTVGEQSIHDLMAAVDTWIDEPEDNSSEAKASHTNFNARVYILTKDEGGRHTPFFSNYQPQVIVNDITQNVTIQLPAGVEMVMPGDDIELIISIENGMLIGNGDIIKLYENETLVGMGLITEIIK